MSAPQFLLHLWGFVLPALVLALVMPLAGRWVFARPVLAWPARVVCHALVGMGVLVLGLMLLGHDGALGTYATLCLTSATLEWGLHRGWRS